MNEKCLSNQFGAKCVSEQPKLNTNVSIPSQITENTRLLSKETEVRNSVVLYFILFFDKNNELCFSFWQYFKTK